MMNPTMGDIENTETLIAGLEWHAKHEPDATVALNSMERDALLLALKRIERLETYLANAEAVGRCAENEIEALRAFKCCGAGDPPCTTWEESCKNPANYDKDIGFCPKCKEPGFPFCATQGCPTFIPAPPPNKEYAHSASFQGRVAPWMQECFGPVISSDVVERNHRFIEEALELVQASGCTRSEAHQLVDYVFGRPAGNITQEVGGVMVTLAALCLARGIDMHECGETELARIWTCVEKIRAKQAAKPKHSPLPAPVEGVCIHCNGTGRPNPYYHATANGGDK